jgi:hypothetical protein
MCGPASFEFREIKIRWNLHFSAIFRSSRRVTTGRPRKESIQTKTETEFDGEQYDQIRVCQIQSFNYEKVTGIIRRLPSACQLFYTCPFGMVLAPSTIGVGDKDPVDL